LPGSPKSGLGGSDSHARGATKIHPVAPDAPYGAAYRPAAQKLSGFLAASKGNRHEKRHFPANGLS